MLILTEANVMVHIMDDTMVDTMLVVTGTCLLFSHIFGMSSSQLTFIFFQRGSNHQPVNILVHIMGDIMVDK